VAVDFFLPTSIDIVAKTAAAVKETVKKHLPIRSPLWPSTLRTSTPAAPATPATATSEKKKLHLLLQSVASSFLRTNCESFLDPPFGFPLSCPAYETPAKKAKSKNS